MNRFATIFFFLIFLHQISAQVSRIPLDYNPAIPQQQLDFLPKGYTQSQAKAACDPSDLNKTYVEAGQTVIIEIDVDTFELYPNGGQFACANCNTAQFGTAQLSATGDSLLYTASSTVTLGEDAIEVRFCRKADPTDCLRNRVYRIVAKRAGQHYFLPTQSVLPGASTSVNLDANVLPGALVCNYFVDCPDQYQGRDQIAYFSSYSRPDTTVIYQASRYPGVDSLCVGICDENAVCDTFHLSFEIAASVLGLPFMDDFSYAGPATDPALWLDREVFVNNTLGENPPSIGMATMDGLDARGQPYGGGTGEADRLTSTLIDLNGEIGNVVLTYWLQRQGLADKPEANDSLRLEFRSVNGEWRRATAYGGIPPNQPNTVEEPFRFYATPVPANFRHEDFQFRFVNIADRQGVRDNWHLDYIRLSTEDVDSIFADVAFAETPRSILDNYSAMPWRHFRAGNESLLAPDLEASLYNHADEALNVTPSSVTLIEETTNVSPFGAPVTLFNGTEANIPNGVSVNRSYLYEGDPNSFPSIWSTYTAAMFGPNFPDNGELRFRMSYKLTNLSQVEELAYASVQRNDEVSALTTFDNYFAYDDGTAEQGLVAQEGTRVAIRFDAGVADSLRAIQFMHPRSNEDVSEQQFQIMIWLEALDDTPEFSMTINPFFADLSFDTIQGFTTYVLQDQDGNPSPLAIPTGAFYVGWSQLTPCTFNRCVPVGYDRNREEGAAFTFVNIGQGWIPLAEPERGSLLIRPVVGGETPIPTATKNPIAFHELVEVYPNPSLGKIYLRSLEGQLEDQFFTLFNQVGQQVVAGALKRELSFNELSAGLYIMKIRDSRERKQQIMKISIVR